MLSQIGWVVGICGAASAALSLAGLGACAIWRCSSAAQRHFVLTAVVIATLLLPLGELFSPKVEVEVPASIPRETVQRPLSASIVVFSASAPEASFPEAAMTVPPKAPAAKVTAKWRWPEWRITEAGAFLWMLGLAWLLISQLIASAQLRRIRRSSAPIALKAMDAAAREMGLRRIPEVGTHPRIIVPIVFGVIRPIILLPESAASWSPECQRTVLRHEMAHLQRGDLILQRLIDLAVIAYWFNPILRLVAARIRKEREKACDDLVITRCGNGPDYAENLLEIVQGTRFPIPAGAIGMAASSDLGSRIRQILSATANRVAPSRPMRIGMSLLCLITVAFFGTVRFVEAQSPSKSAAEPQAEVEPKTEPAASPVPLKTVRLTVQNADGKPLEGATVDELLASSQPPVGLEQFSAMPGVSFTTNGEGIAEVRFPKIPEGEGGLIMLSARIRHPEYLTREVKIDLKALRPVVLSRGYKLELKATRSGAVLPSVWADLAGNRFQRNLPWSRVGEAANIVLSNPQSVRVVAFDADSRPLFSSPLAVEGKPGSELHQTLEVAPGRDRKGRLSANVPRPVKNGRVIAWVSTPSAIPGQDGHEWRSYAKVQPDGTFTLEDLPDGDLRLVALCDDYVSTTLKGDFSSQWYSEGLFYPSDSAEVEIPMSRTGSAEITILGPEGKPLEGIKVSFQPLQQLKKSEDREALGLLVSTADRLLGRKTPDAVAHFQATTDAEGKATVEQLPAGMLSWSAEIDDRQIPVIDPRGEVGRVWHLNTRPGAVVKETMRVEAPETTGKKKITVRSVSGEPIEGAVVQLQAGRSDLNQGLPFVFPEGQSPAEVRTNAKGEAELTYPLEIPFTSSQSETIPVSALSAVVRHPDFMEEHVELPLKEDFPILMKKGITVIVTAHLSGSKEPLSRVWADLGDTYGGVLTWKKVGRTTLGVLSAPQSVRAISFALDGAPLFSKPTLIDGPPGERRELPLEVSPGREWHGRLSANVPRPVKNGVVNALVSTPSAIQGAPHRWNLRADVNAEGEFTLSGAPEGKLFVVALCDGFVSTNEVPEQHLGRYGQQFPADARQPLGILMEPTGTAEITVLNPDGKPVKNASVSLWPTQHLDGWSGPLGGGASSAEELLEKEKSRDIDPYSAYSARTGADGKAVIPNLPPGSGTFSVEAEGLEMPIVIDQGGRPNRTSEITLIPGRTSRQTVRMERPQPGKLREALQQVHEETLPERSLPVLPSPYTDTGAPYPVEPGEHFRGQIVDVSGKPISGVNLYDRDDLKAVTDSTGSFSISGGENIDLRIRKPGYSPVHVLQQPTGSLKAPIVLSQETYFEGTVVNTKGEPIVNQRVRAFTPVKVAPSRRYFATPISYETRTDAKGRYRLYVHPDSYQFYVRSHEYGVARRMNEVITADTHRTIDLTLIPGGTFRAQFVDSATGKPVAGVQLQIQDEPEYIATSDKNGEIQLQGVPAGLTAFQIDPLTTTYKRWWSADAYHSYQRYPEKNPLLNQGLLEFIVKPPETRVTITLEKP